MLISSVKETKVNLSSSESNATFTGSELSCLKQQKTVVLSLSPLKLEEY